MYRLRLIVLKLLLTLLQFFVTFKSGFEMTLFYCPLDLGIVVDSGIQRFLVKLVFLEILLIFTLNHVKYELILFKKFFIPNEFHLIILSNFQSLFINLLIFLQLIYDVHQIDHLHFQVILFFL